MKTLTKNIYAVQFYGIVSNIMQKRSKKGEIIGVSGVPGSFSEEAARVYAAKIGLKTFKISYLTTVENVLAGLEKGEVTLGIFPVMNSIGGIVLETVQAVSKHNFVVKKIFEIEIHQNLLVKKGTTPDKIKQILSHDQAVKQCRGYLKRVWPKVKVGAYPDTAKAAKDLAEGTLTASTGVIASRAAARLYKLDILGASIQDDKNNLTTFIAARK